MRQYIRTNLNKKGAIVHLPSFNSNLHNMKKSTFLTLSLIAAFSQAAFSQTVTDTIETGAGYTNDVYYSLENGEVKTAPNSEWQLAFGIGTFNVAIRANTAAASSGEGSVIVYECPETDMSKWATFSTVGYDGWPVLENTDEDWEVGAFNVNAGDFGTFDYGWGEYDQNTHVVSGNRFFVIDIKTNGSVVTKKLHITSKDFGIWYLKYADLDGSNEKMIEIDPANYSGKNFAYLSLLTGTLINREPATSAWDFMLTRYRGWQQQGQYYPVTGILTNFNVATSEVNNKNEDSTILADTLGNSFSANISIIGSDWKQLNSTMTAYEVVDNRTYFVKAKDGDFWKVVFTGFGGSANGQTIFNKTKIETTTGIAKVGNNVKNLSVYPNPASDIMNVLFDVETAGTTITVTDLAGKTMLEELVAGNGFKNHAINVNNLAKGIYLLNVTNGDSRAVQKIVVN